MFTKITGFMKVSGSKTSGTVEDLKFLLTEIRTRVHITKANQQVEAFTLGRMEKFMTVSGVEVPSMDTVFGRVYLKILILESGSKIKLRVMACMFGRTTTNMKGNG